MARKPELEVIKKIELGFDCLCDNVLYFEEYDRLVVVTNFDISIQVFDMSNYEMIKIFRTHSDRIFDLIKLDDETFLSCSEDTRIFSFCIDELVIKNYYLVSPVGVLNMMKFGYDFEPKILILTSRGNFMEIDCQSSRGKKLKIPEMKEVSVRSKLFPSKIHQKRFYCNTDRVTVSCIDIEEEKIVKQYFFGYSVFSINILVKEFVEYLLIMGDSFNIVIYDTSDPDLSSPYGVINAFNTSIYSSYCLGHSFLMAACNQEIELYGNFLENRFYNKRVKTNWIIRHTLFDEESRSVINNVELMKIDARGKSLLFAFCSKNMVKIVKIMNLPIDEMYEEERQDQKDRTNFLIHYSSTLEEENFIRQNVRPFPYIRIKVYPNKIQYLYRSFFMW